MFPTINGKNIIDCEYDDLQMILGNPDYAENEYIDYKKTFAIDDVPRDKKQQEQVEFRNDVCSFANTSGGYLIFGIEETAGVPNKIIGISIKNNNADLFEREILNYLQFIMPRVPYYKLKLIPTADNKYIVILFIQHDFYAPYIHVESQKNYKVFKRVGNSKALIEYQELKAMFTQSISFENEIANYRRNRIEKYLTHEDNDDHEYSQFVMFHIIPDSFLDSSYDKPLYILDRSKNKLREIFDSFECSTRPIPTVGGMRFRGNYVNTESRLNNNGIAEFVYPLKNYIWLDQAKGVSYVYWENIWKKLEQAIPVYIREMGRYLSTQKIYMCLSLVGIKNYYTRVPNWHEDFETIGTVENEKLLCEPIEFQISDDCSAGSLNMKRLMLNILLSLGIRWTKEMEDIIKEIYGQ